MCCERRVLNVPIKPHLKKFLLKTTDLPEPFRLDEHTSVGKNLIKALRDRQEAANLSERQTDVLAIELSSRAAKMSPGVSQLLYINSLLDEMFQESLILWIFAQSYAGVNPHNSCKSFLFFFNIDENEYTYDAAHKAWLRYRSSKKDRLKKIARKGPKIFPKMSE